MPLSTAMCLNVILPNLSLAYSTVAFYQIVRVLLTPTVAVINFILHGTKVPQEACYAMLPVCLGVAIVTYFDTRQSPSGIETTSAAGVFFSCTGILASSLYTVWIGTYRKKLNLDSMQLLLNTAPTSAFLLLYVIPMTDLSPRWTQVEAGRYGLILLVSLLLFTWKFQADTDTEWCPCQHDQYLSVLHRCRFWSGQQHCCRAPQDLLDCGSWLDSWWPRCN